MSVAPAPPQHSPVVVKIAESTNGKQLISFVESILGQPGGRVTFDCEGVDLSRLGTVEIISICFPSKQVFLLDFSKPCPKIASAVKRLFESDSVTKIIHDCRMDCDALFHLHGIRVNNIHDTSCFHEAISSKENKNLNDVLAFYKIGLNAVRDKNVYRDNPKFWATRPLTNKMIEWASSDVNKLFDLADNQLKQISVLGKARAATKSQEYSNLLLDMKVVSGLKVQNPGLFIGTGGANIRKTERDLGVFCYQKSDGWFAYYESDSSLNRLLLKMGIR